MLLDVVFYYTAVHVLLKEGGGNVKLYFERTGVMVLKNIFIMDGDRSVT